MGFLGGVEHVVRRALREVPEFADDRNLEKIVISLAGRAVAAVDPSAVFGENAGMFVCLSW